MADYGKELVRVKRVGLNPYIIVCEVCYGVEAGREVSVRVREAGRWKGWEGKEMEVAVKGVEPWEYVGRGPGMAWKSRRRYGGREVKRGLVVEGGK